MLEDVNLALQTIHAMKNFTRSFMRRLVTLWKALESSQPAANHPP